MEYNIKFSESGNFIIVEVLTDITIDLVIKFSLDLKKLTKEYNVRRYLFDMRNSRNVATVTENFSFANKEFDRLQLSRSGRSAILVRSDDDSHRFVETALRNSGANIKLFTKMEDAVAWIEGKID